MPRQPFYTNHRDRRTRTQVTPDIDKESDMNVRYLKSASGHTVIRVSNAKLQPEIPAWCTAQGYTEIDFEEFKALRKKIKRMTNVRHGFTADETELKKHLTKKAMQS